MIKIQTNVRKGASMDFKVELHKLIDKLDESMIEHIYYIVLGMIGKVF